MSARRVLLILALTGCASPLPSPESRVVTVPVDRLIQIKCMDNRPMADAYPASDDALARIPAGDFEGLAKAFRATVDLMRARLLVDDVQIKACAGE